MSWSKSGEAFENVYKNIVAGAATILVAAVLLGLAFFIGIIPLLIAEDFGIIQNTIAIILGLSGLACAIPLIIGTFKIVKHDFL